MSERLPPSVNREQKIAKVCKVKGIAAGIVSHEQIEMTAVNSDISAISRILFLNLIK